MKGKKCNKSKYMVLKSGSWDCFLSSERPIFLESRNGVSILLPRGVGEGGEEFIEVDKMN